MTLFEHAMAVPARTLSLAEARDIALHPQLHTNNEINAAVYVILHDDQQTDADWWAAQALRDDYDPGYFTPVF